ncbi:MAG: bifunctional diguanylate cyclase/phosphodiesterase [Acidobacteriaceae bacterium]|nr:bifunctional diguanylate cyclase/phosphodiesterase [Acidobacteriaceae bacterium]
MRDLSHVWPCRADIKIVRGNGNTSNSPNGSAAPLEIEPNSVALLAALEAASEGILIFDSQLRLLHITETFRAQMRLQTEGPFLEPELLDLLNRADLTPESLACVRGLLANLEDAQTPSALDLRLRDRTLLRFQLRKPSADLFAAYLSRGSDQEHEHGTASNHTDLLTGLASRARFEDAIGSTLKQTSKFAILLLDLDGFKLVNDTLGHAAASALLVRVAQRLRTATREDDIVARLDGEKLAILITTSASSEAAAQVGRRILDLVQRTYLINGQVVTMAASIGIALAPDHGCDSQSLLRNADLALEHPKAGGGPRLSVFEPAMLERAVARRTNELDLRSALPLRQFEVHYQPQVSMEGALVGFEALVRWRHPERGLIPPNDFLPLVEEIGLMSAVGDWVLRSACREAAHWPQDLIVAVNASPLQIEGGRFADSVRRALACTGLPGRRLEIEITEGALLCNNDVVMRTLAELRSFGVRIAMDDFGTGYASLSQLARFPFDKIKIDRSLVAGSEAKKRAIVRAITAMGHSLGVRTVAEGVEEHEQMERLKHDGCSVVQGYLYGRPVPVSEVPAVISKLYRVRHESTSIPEPIFYEHSSPDCVLQP